jgi:hypothetical protein
MDRLYCIESPAVVSDIIDGEAIMLHRLSGDYFSTSGVGGLIWQWIGEGRSRDRMLELLNARFAAGPKEIAEAVDVFLADLMTHKLVRETREDGEQAASASIEPGSGLGAAFAPPVLHVYSQIRKLLLLDPIHEVAEDVGWPEAKEPGAGA